MGSKTYPRPPRQTTSSCVPASSAASNVQRRCCRGRRGRHAAPASVPPSASAYSGSRPPSRSCPGCAHRSCRARSAVRRTTVRSAPGGRPGVPRPAGRAPSLRSRRARRCVAGLRAPAATGWPRGHRRTCVAHAPSRPLRSRRDRTGRRILRSHPPAGCHGMARGEPSGVPPCGPDCSNTAPPAAPCRRTAGHRAHSTTAARSWSCRGPDRAPVPWCRPRAPAPLS